MSDVVVHGSSPLRHAENVEHILRMVGWPNEELIAERIENAKEDRYRVFIPERGPDGPNQLDSANSDATGYSGLNDSD